MPITICCPHCAKSLTAKDEHRGKRVKCPSCGKPVGIPAGFAITAGPEQERIDDTRQKASTLLVCAVGSVILFIVLVVLADAWWRSHRNKALRAIVNDIRDVCDAGTDKVKYLSYVPNVAKVLVWDLERDRPRRIPLLPKTIQASPKDTQITVFLVSKRGSQETDEPDVDVFVVQWPQKQLVGYVPFTLHRNIRLGDVPQMKGFAYYYKVEHLDLDQLLSRFIRKKCGLPAEGPSGPAEDSVVPRHRSRRRHRR